MTWPQLEELAMSHGLKISYTGSTVTIGRQTGGAVNELLRMTCWLAPAARDAVLRVMVEQAIEKIGGSNAERAAKP